MTAPEHPPGWPRLAPVLVSDDQPPLVRPGADWRCTVTGRFYRAIDPAYRDQALAGSRLAGRYSAADQPTLYLSSSPEGVEAAMAAHDGARGELAIVRFDVHATGIVDLRDAAARHAAGVAIADAVAPWQDTVAAGSPPPSWQVRRRLDEVGAQGLIDPSRTRPGLWHLVLFTWNVPRGARVSPAGAR